MRLLSDDGRRPSNRPRRRPFRGPVPTQIVSSDEYFPSPQSAEQRRVEARVKALADELGRRRGLSRRAFFRTASGMAAAYVAMNEVFGRYFDASLAEAADRRWRRSGAEGLAGQFVMDTHTHFLRDDTRLEGFVRQREAVGRAGWNPASPASRRPSKISSSTITSRRSSSTPTPRWHCSPARRPRCPRTGSSPMTWRWTLAPR